MGEYCTCGTARCICDPGEQPVLTLTVDNNKTEIQHDPIPTPELGLLLVAFLLWIRVKA